MAILGLITDEGVSKSIALQNEEGYKIVPYKFSVAETSGPLIPSRSMSDLETTWFEGPISASFRISHNTIELSCNIPAEQSPDPRFTRELYIFGLDENNNDFLLGLAHPTSELTYDPEGELRIRVQFTLSNINIGDLYEFKYTQATEIEDHNLDPEAHPDIQKAMNKAGIYKFPSENRFNGQFFDGYPVISANVFDKYVVYYNTVTARYEPALSDVTDGRENAIGFYDAFNHIVITKGIIDYPNSLPPYTPIYLSSFNAGSASAAVSSVLVGRTLPNNRLLVGIEFDSSQSGETNFDGDVTINLAPPLVRELTLQDEDGILWDVKVDTDGLLYTVPYSLRLPDVIFRIPKINLSYAQIKVLTNGVLFVESPPSEPTAITDEFYYLEDPNGIAWKITVNLQNEIVTMAHSNSFLIKSENNNHFSVKQIDPNHALTYLQVFDSVPEVAPPIVNGLLPMAFYNTGVQDVVVPLFHDGNTWQRDWAVVGDRKESLLPEAQFQQIHGPNWVIGKGQNIEGTRLAQILGITNLPEARGRFARAACNVPDTPIQSVNSTNNTLRIDNHDYSTGFAIRITGPVPAPLAINTTYYCRVVDANNISVCSSYSNAISNTVISLTNTTSGGTIRQWEDPDRDNRTGERTDVGAYQGDAIRNITGTFFVAARTRTSDGVFSNVAGNEGQSFDAHNFYSQGRYRFDASTVVPTGGDNRPSNILHSVFYKIN